MGKSQLTKERVHKILVDTMIHPEEIKPKEFAKIIVHGIKLSYSFSPERLKWHRKAIMGMLSDLEEKFIVEGQGEFFERMTVDRHGNKWGDENDAEELLVLAGAVNMIRSRLAVHDSWIIGFVIPRQ
jgi:hypothetical protein